MTPPAQCIYCKRTDVRFNREHVIPEAFGSYGADTMVLGNNEVCEECNSGLGREIDQILSRDSFEALLRANSLPQGHGAGERFSPRRSRIYLPDEEQFGILRGARLAIDWNTRRPKLLDQIIIRSRDGQLHTFLADEFQGADASLFQDLERGAVRVVGTDQDKFEALAHLVRDRGIQIGNRESLSVPSALVPPEIRTVIEGQIDIRTWRAIAKIAFNYLAYNEGAAFVLADRFDPIRDYIRGVPTDQAMVRLLNTPIIVSETYTWRAFDGHLVAYQREDRRLMGKVSLYNSITYEVMLCSNLGLYYSIKKGHAFDPAERRATTIASMPFQVLQPSEAIRLLSFFPLENR